MTDSERESFSSVEEDEDAEGSVYTLLEDFLFKCFMILLNVAMIIFALGIIGFLITAIVYAAIKVSVSI